MNDGPGSERRVICRVFVVIVVCVCVLRQQALFHVLTAYSMYNTVSHLALRLHSAAKVTVLLLSVEVAAAVWVQLSRIYFFLLFLLFF